MGVAGIQQRSLWTRRSPQGLLPNPFAHHHWRVLQVTINGSTLTGAIILVEWLLPTISILCSNPVISYVYLLSRFSCRVVMIPLTISYGYGLIMPNVGYQEVNMYLLRPLNQNGCQLYLPMGWGVFQMPQPRWYLVKIKWVDNRKGT